VGKDGDIVATLLRLQPGEGLTGRGLRILKAEEMKRALMALFTASPRDDQTSSHQQAEGDAQFDGVAPVP
jgi:hypothetical protein